MKGTLYIVESPGKVKKLRELLNTIGETDYSVAASYGRIYDLPEKSLGIDTENYSINSRVELKPSVIASLTKAGKKRESIVLMTDGDIEGEVIANDLSTLFDGKEISRTTIRRFTPSSIIDALNSKTAINQNLVSAGLSRRIYDRILGYRSIADSSEKHLAFRGSTVGRVSTPIISAINSDEPATGFIQKVVKSQDGHKWQINFEINASSRSNSESFFKLLSSLPDPLISESHSHTEPLVGKPLTAGAALDLISDVTLCSVDEAHNCLQELYENGDIPYHRTDSSEISFDSAQEVLSLAASYGVNGVSAEHLFNNSRLSHELNAEGSHEGIIPLTDRVSPHSRLDSLSLTDKALCLITRHALLAAQPGRLLTTHSGSLANSDGADRSWVQAIESWPGRVEIKRESITAGRSREPKECNSLLKPHGFLTHSGTTMNGVYSRLYNNDLIVLRLLSKYQLARPSTLHMHSTKIASQYMNGSGGLSTKGVNSLILANTTAPNLLRPDLAKDVERELTKKGNCSTKERVVLALEKSGIAINESASMPHEISIEKDSEDYELI